MELSIDFEGLFDDNESQAQEIRKIDGPFAIIFDFKK
jgi:hypothetical protein